MSSFAAAPLHVAPSIVSVFPDVAALRNRFLWEFSLGGLFVPGPSDAGVGRHVCLDVSLVHESICLQAPAVVRWKRHRAGVSLPRGIGVEVIAGRMLIALAQGTARQPCRARARRFHVDIPVTYDVAGQAERGAISDLSRTGVFVHCAKLPPLPCQTCLRLQVAPGTAIGVPVEVMRLQDVPVRGFGARFVSSSPALGAALAALLAEVGAAATRTAPPPLPAAPSA